jgi:hypothetical protein
MRRIYFLMMGLLLLCAGNLHAQLFNAPRELGKGGISLGIEPAVYTRGSTDLLLFMHGGVGLTKTTELSLHAGIGNTNYLGADLEWMLARNLTLVTGVHNFESFGLNGAIAYNVPLGNSASFWFGADADIDFADPEVLFPVWIPVGVEVRFKEKMAFLLESEIALSDPARHIISGGLVFYLR